MSNTKIEGIWYCYFSPGLCSQDDIHCNTRPSNEHSGGLLAVDMGKRVGSHCHANSAGGEGKGIPEYPTVYRSKSTLDRTIDVAEAFLMFEECHQFV